MNLDDGLRELFDMYSTARIFEAIGELAEIKRDAAMDETRSKFWHEVSNQMYKLERKAEKNLR